MKHTYVRIEAHSPRLSWSGVTSFELIVRILRNAACPYLLAQKQFIGSQMVHEEKDPMQKLHMDPPYHTVEQVKSWWKWTYFFSHTCQIGWLKQGSFLQRRGLVNLPIHVEQMLVRTHPGYNFKSHCFWCHQLLHFVSALSSST